MDEGYCKTVCDQGYYGYDGRCRKCPFTCKTCEYIVTDSAMKCTECKVSHFSEGRGCAPCHKTCKTCSPTKDDCTSCSPPRFLSDNKCVISGKCKEQTYQNVDTNECSKLQILFIFIYYFEHIY